MTGCWTGFPLERISRCETTEQWRLGIVFTDAHGYQDLLVADVYPSPLTEQLFSVLQSRLRATDKVSSWLGSDAALRARGRYNPMLPTEQDQGGPGELAITDDGPVFLTDRGVQHSYEWDGYKNFAIEGNKVSLYTEALIGSWIDVEVEDPSAWRAACEEHGLPERCPGLPWQKP